MSDTRIKLLEQNLTSFKIKLRSATDKDQVRRQIKATEELLKVERAKS